MNHIKIKNIPEEENQKETKKRLNVEFKDSWAELKTRIRRYCADPILLEKGQADDDLIIICSIVVSALIFIMPIQQHTDTCLLAKMCNHTWVSECGIDRNSSRTRLFLDNCDMYEYNCDYKKEYTKIGIRECPQDCNKIAITVASTLTTPLNSETQSSSTSLVTTNTTASTTLFESATHSEPTISSTPATTSIFEPEKENTSETITISNTT